MTGPYRGRLDYPAVLAALHRKEGRWAAVDVADHLPSSATTLKRRYGITVTTRTQEDGAVTVWATWPPSPPRSAVEAVAHHQASGAPIPKLRFGGPPPRGRGGRQTLGRYDLLAAKTRSRPGRWLTAGTTTPAGRVSMALSLRKRGCDVTTRTTSESVCAVWVRWPTSRKVGSLPVATSGPQDRWEDPPLRHGRRDTRPENFDYFGVAEALFRRPGRWARIWGGPADRLPLIRRWFSAQGFSVATRKDADDPTSVQMWSRWPQRTTRSRSTALQRKLKRRAAGAPPPLQWCNPPDHKVKKVVHANPVFELKSKPGQWALIGTYPAPQANRVRRGLREDGCEVVTRAADAGERTVWARWQK